MKLLESLGIQTTPDLVAVKDDPEYREAFATLRTAQANHAAAKIEASRFPIERVTLASLQARERHALAEAAETTARQALEAVHARKQAAITAAFEPQLRAALQRFYQHLIDDVLPLAEAVRDIQGARNRLLDGGGVDLPPMVRMMVGMVGACGEQSQLEVESAAFLAEH